MNIIVTSVNILSFAGETESSFKNAISTIKVPLNKAHVQAYNDNLIPDLGEEMTQLEAELNSFNITLGLNKGGSHHDKAYQLATNRNDAYFDIYSTTNLERIGNVRIKIDDTDTQK